VFLMRKWQRELDYRLIKEVWAFRDHRIAVRFAYLIPPNAFVILPCLVRPRSRGYLRLRTADPNGLLEIQPNFLAEQADVEALASCVELGLDLASQPAYRDLVKRWVVPPERMSREATVAFVRRSCSSYLHPVSTCAMGSDREAVVDAELRVRGALGLRVADASVMPTIPSANTNASGIMIGEFASRLLEAGRSEAVLEPARRTHTPSRDQPSRAEESSHSALRSRPLDPHTPTVNRRTPWHG
jgi:choline dehydrogenase-like flavoprotein